MRQIRKRTTTKISSVGTTAILLGTTMILFGLPAEAASPGYSLEGRITQCSSGLPVPGLSVKLSRKSGRTVGEAVTSENGEYQLIGAIRRKGRYNIGIYWGNDLIKRSEVSVFSRNMNLPDICL